MAAGAERDAAGVGTAELRGAGAAAGVPARDVEHAGHQRFRDCVGPADRVSGGVYDGDGRAAAAAGADVRRADPVLDQYPRAELRVDRAAAAARAGEPGADGARADLAAVGAGLQPGGGA